MYMEAYGSVGNWADSIIKKGITGAITRQIAKEDAKEALSKQGVSPSEGGGSSNATPEAIAKPQANDINDELMASKKAIKSLNKKLANIQAKADYQKSMAGFYKKELFNKMKKEMVGVK